MQKTFSKNVPSLRITLGVKGSPSHCSLSSDSSSAIQYTRIMLYKDHVFAACKSICGLPNKNDVAEDGENVYTHDDLLKPRVKSVPVT